MIELLKEVEELAEIEKARANEKFPMFNSNHEGIAIIEEELNEAIDDLKNAVESFEKLKKGVFSDNTEDIKKWRSIMANELNCAIAEAVQTLAMVIKFRESREVRIRNGKGWEEEKRPD